MNDIIKKKYNSFTTGFSKCEFFNNGVFSSFMFLNGRVTEIPYNIRIKLEDGILSSVDISLNGICKNILDNYPSYISDSIDIVTNEEQKLNFYKMQEITMTHNVFTSILYVISILINKNQVFVTNKYKELLKIDDLSLIDTNYHIYINKNTDSKKLVLLETKIFFWWYFISKNLNKEINHSGFFAFYLWIFRNLNNIDTPTIFGNNTLHIPKHEKYFNLIDNAKNLKELFILRYGPKYLSYQELLNEPEKIFTFYDLENCASNLRNYLLK